jgi:curved DNA-binding protein
VPTLDGEVQMTLPPGQSSGQRLRLRGKGLPRRGEARGDLFAELKIVVPSKLSPEQERLFTELRKVSC